MMIGTGLGMVDRDVEVGKEYKVGTFTLNGVTYDRYVKIVDCGALPNASTSTVNHGITFSGVLSVSGVSRQSNGNVAIPIPYAEVSNNNALYINIGVRPSTITITDNANFSEFTKTFITLEYYK